MTEANDEPENVSKMSNFVSKFQKKLIFIIEGNVRKCIKIIVLNSKILYYDIYY